MSKLKDIIEPRFFNAALMVLSCWSDGANLIARYAIFKLLWG